MFFSLVEQVSWVFLNTAYMAPFRNLLSPKYVFCLTQELGKAFQRTEGNIPKWFKKESEISTHPKLWY